MTGSFQPSPTTGALAAMDDEAAPPPETGSDHPPPHSIDAPPDAPAGSPHAAPLPPRASVLLREMPYVLVLALTLVGVAYMSFSKQSIVGFWELLTPLIAVVCIANGWRHAHDWPARQRLIWTQVVHWLAFVVAMNLVLLSGVQATFTSNSAGLVVLTLIALGTFTAGVHILSWQICALGVVMALGIPGIAWVERSSLFLLLIVLVVVAVGAALWWNQRSRRATE
jgi:hypothetical protein